MTAETKHPERITGAVKDAATLPAGFRLEPKKKVVLLKPTIVDGQDAAVGDTVEVDGNLAAILIGDGSAEDVERAGSGDGSSNVQFTGTGNGTLVLAANGPNAVTEKVTVTLSSATSFDVNGAVSGVIGVPGTVGTPFTSDKVNFTITAGDVPFAAGDAFTFLTTAAAPPAKA